MNIDQIVAKHKKAVDRFLITHEIPDELFDDLFAHYTGNGEMPYGVAKARTGDPHEWLAEKLTQALGQLSLKH